ncbi:MAG: hypothetical protein HRU32_16300 [Rhodobacteraceae bacterium]|nr:hypothetical protein [Paracoccaceae bacterium]
MIKLTKNGSTGTLRIHPDDISLIDESVEDGKTTTFICLFSREGIFMVEECAERIEELVAETTTSDEEIRAWLRTLHTEGYIDGHNGVKVDAEDTPAYKKLVELLEVGE